MRYYQNRVSAYAVLLLVIGLSACARDQPDPNCLDACFPAHGLAVDVQKLEACRTGCFKAQKSALTNATKLCERLVDLGMTKTDAHFTPAMSPQEKTILRETAYTRCLQAILKKPGLKKCLIKAQTTEEIRLCR